MPLGELLEPHMAFIHSVCWGIEFIPQRKLLLIAVILVSKIFGIGIQCIPMLGYLGNMLGYIPMLGK